MIHLTHKNTNTVLAPRHFQLRCQQELIFPYIRLPFGSCFLFSPKTKLVSFICTNLLISASFDGQSQNCWQFIVTVISGTRNKVKSWWTAFSRWPGSSSLSQAWQLDEFRCRPHNRPPVETNMSWRSCMGYKTLWAICKASYRSSEYLHNVMYKSIYQA